jgi:hypothetical protein
MSTHPIARTTVAWSMILAPLAGLIGAVALPALRSTRGKELTAIAAHPDRFYVYAISLLISSYLFVPVFVGLLNLIREHSPRLAYLGAGIGLFGMLVAIGDAATELMYWQMGSPHADHAQMTALAERYESAAGSSLVYTIGGFATLLGSVLVAVALWRARAVPRWTAVGIPVGVVANVAGFGAASQPVLVASYVVLLAALGRIASVVLNREPALAAAPAVAVA